MILDDLRRFRASPEVPRLAVALFATAAVMLAATGSWQLCGENECEGEPAIGALVRPSQMGSQPLLAESANGYLGTYAPGQVAPHDSKRHGFYVAQQRT